MKPLVVFAEILRKNRKEDVISNHISIQGEATLIHAGRHLFEDWNVLD